MSKDIPFVIPIITPDIDWNNYVGTIYKLLKRSPNRRLDDANRPVGDYSSFLESLGEFSHQSQYVADMHLQHLSFSFLIHPTKDEYIEILRQSDLHCVDNLSINERELIVIMSGTVSQWKIACYKFCSHEYSFRVRYIFDAIALLLEKYKVFRLAKRFVPDETFVLEKP